MSESLDILDIIGKDFKIVKLSNGLYTTAEHDSLRIWTETNSWYWWKNNVGGNALTWLKYYHKLSDSEISESYEITEPVLDPFKTTQLNRYTICDDIDISLLYGKKVYSDYIKNRGVNYESFLKYELEMVNQYYALIPIKDRNGNRIGALHRKLDDKLAGPKYKKFFNGSNDKFRIFNYENLRNTTKYGIVLLFEGAWSVIRFEQVLGDKIKCIANLGNRIDERVFESLNDLTNVYIVLDNDDAGKEIQKKYPKQKFILTNIYPDELTDEQIVNVYERILDNVKPAKTKITRFTECKSRI